MALFKVAAFSRGKREESTPTTSEAAADALATRWKSEKKRARVITILRDSQGADHPANAGTFFLHRIVK